MLQRVIDQSVLVAENGLPYLELRFLCLLVPELRSFITSFELFFTFVFCFFVSTVDDKPLYIKNSYPGYTLYLISEMLRTFFTEYYLRFILQT